MRAYLPSGVVKTNVPSNRVVLLVAVTDCRGQKERMRARGEGQYLIAQISVLINLQKLN